MKESFIAGNGEAPPLVCAPTVTVGHMRDVEDAWWSSLVGAFAASGRALVRRVEHDLALGEDPLPTVVALVREKAPDLRLVATRRWSDRGVNVLFANDRGILAAFEGSDNMRVSVWSRDDDTARTLAGELAGALPRAPACASEGSIPFTFWHRKARDGSVEHTVKNVDCPRFGDVARNYSSRIVPHLRRVFDMKKPEEVGKILLWFGPPGTGKTHAVRALARHWARELDACVEIVLDPETLFDSTTYLHEILFEESHWRDGIRSARRRQGSAQRKEAPLRLIVLEDSAELFSGQCRASLGFSRFLNLTDGILGQGLRCVFLLTANEEVGKIDPALTRHGRCLQALEFQPLDSDEAGAWLERHGCSRGDARRGMTLSDLYALRAARPETEVGAGARFGF